MLKRSSFALACLALTACSLDLMGTYEAPVPDPPPLSDDAAPPDAAPPADDASASTDAAPVDAAPKEAGAPGCPAGFPAEVEPNDPKSEPIGDRICGTVVVGDIDHFSFHSDKRYELDFVGDNSVQFSLWVSGGPTQEMLIAESGTTTYFGDGKDDPITVKVWSLSPTKQLYYFLITPQ
jgi:hypothetical protein